MKYRRGVDITSPMPMSPRAIRGQTYVRPCALSDVAVDSKRRRNGDHIRPLRMHMVSRPCGYTCVFEASSDE